MVKFTTDLMERLQRTTCALFLLFSTTVFKEPVGVDVDWKFCMTVCRCSYC